MKVINSKNKENQQVLLISLPWTNIIEPSLGLALLKSILQNNGYKTRVLHLNVFMLEFFKATSYEALSVVYALNDFLFSAIIDSKITTVQMRLLRNKADELYQAGAFDHDEIGSLDDVIEKLVEFRNVVIPVWLDKWADEIAQSDATLIGFTCMFDQTIASAALAKCVRAKSPEKMLVMGGYAVRSPTGEMIMKSFPWIDAICFGEGEQTIIELARASAGLIPLSHVQGIFIRNEIGEIVSTPTPLKADLNSNPVPNFDDFFEDTKRLSRELLVDLTPASIPMENSRGCWWGAKHHCTFCGIHDDDLAYRHRAAEKVLETLRQLREKYGFNSFRFSDYILPNDFYKTLLPVLAKEEPKFMLSCEMKANVTEDQFKSLADAGFHEVQPGIESFNSNVLRKMDKGVSAIQNIFTLKLGRKYGITILYNILYGFPDDELQEYLQMEELLPKINHFDPPVSCVPVQVTRYAPLQTNPKRFGIAPAVHGPSYELIFSKDFIESSGFNYDDFCYYYERSWENSLYLQQTYDRIYNIVKAWGIPKNDLIARLYREQNTHDRGLIIRDSRFGDDNTVRLDYLAKDILDLCDRPIGVSTAKEIFLSRYSSTSIDDMILQLTDLKLVVTEEERMISLVLPEKPVNDTNHRYGFQVPEEAMNL